MENCEICGKESGKLFLAQIEGANMWVCGSCLTGKKIIKSVDFSKKENRPQYIGKKEEEEIVEHFGEQIRKARERLGLPMKVLAERISEKESTLIRIEKEKGQPTDALRKKLEKELGIKLAVKFEGNDMSSGPRKGAPITLGDAAFSKEQMEKGEEGE